MPSLHDLSLRQLQYVVAVADTLGFHKAAARCHVSQPTLSAQVLQLESCLGVRFRARPAASAADARRRRDRGRACRVSWRETIRRGLLAPARAVHGTLRVGVIPTVAPYFLPEVMPKVAAKYPRLSFVFREERTADIVREPPSETSTLACSPWRPTSGSALTPRSRRTASSRPCRRGTRFGWRKRRLALSNPTTRTCCYWTRATACGIRFWLSARARRRPGLPGDEPRHADPDGLERRRDHAALPSLAVPVENRRGQLEIRPFVRPTPGRTIALIWRPRSPFASVFVALARCLRP